MTLPRSQLVSLEATPYYHCVSRCVRRAFLCGEDRYSGKSFDHRKPWLVKRLKLLGEVFAIDIAAYAIMSNHYHLVLHVDQDRSNRWSTDEVIARWLRLYKGPLLIHRYLNGDSLIPEERRLVDSLAELWRDRLTSLSWFMGCMNEYIARRANREDECKGRFWEGRFTSQALLDKSALLSCMTYVDLNPIRAELSDELITSDFTSIQQRLLQVRRKIDRKCPRLMPFREKQREDQRFQAIPYNLKDYIDLVDWTGRHVHPKKRGLIPSNKPKMLSALKLSDAQWQVLALEIQKKSILMLNGLDRLSAWEKRRASAKKVA
jgi:REP element-mobilizing transposase RayT